MVRPASRGAANTSQHQLSTPRHLLGHGDQDAGGFHQGRRPAAPGWLRTYSAMPLSWRGSSELIERLDRGFSEPPVLGLKLLLTRPRWPWRLAALRGWDSVARRPIGRSTDLILGRIRQRSGHKQVGHHFPFHTEGERHDEFGQSFGGAIQCFRTMATYNGCALQWQ